MSTHWKISAYDGPLLENERKRLFLSKYSIINVLANKIANLEFAIQTPQHLTYLGWTVTTGFFSALYHPQCATAELTFHLKGDRLQKKFGCGSSS